MDTYSLLRSGQANRSPILIVDYKGLSCAINRSCEGNLNIITNFNPIRNHRFVDLLDSCQAVEFVRSTQRYSDDEGGINVQLKKGCDEQTLRQEIEIFFRAIEG